MRTSHVTLEEDIRIRWQSLAETHGPVPEDEMRDAITERLEELEDYYVVKSRLTSAFDPVPNEEVWRRLDAGRASGAERT